MSDTGGTNQQRSGNQGAQGGQGTGSSGTSEAAGHGMDIGNQPGTGAGIDTGSGTGTGARSGANTGGETGPAEVEGHTMPDPATQPDQVGGQLGQTEGREG